MKIDWRPKDVRDLDAIVDYIAADNPVAAVEQGDEIYEQVTDIKNFPGLGTPMRDTHFWMSRMGVPASRVGSV